MLQGTTLRPMGIGDLIDATIQLFRKNFWLFLGIAAVLQVPLAILSMAQLAVLGPGFLNPLALVQQSATGSVAANQLAGMLAFYVISLFVLAILSVLASVVIQAALAHGIAQRYLNRPTGVRQAYRVAGRRLWRMLATVILLALIFIAIWIGIVVIVSLAITAAITQQTSVVILSVVVSAVVVLGATILTAFMTMRWSLVVQAIVVENLGIRKSMGRSWRLVRGHGWRMFGALLIGTIITYVVSGVPGSIVSVVLTGIGTLINPSGIVFFSIVASAINAVFSIIAAPMLPIVSTLMYYDLRVRKEGFDLEVLAEQLSKQTEHAEGQPEQG